MSQLKELDLLKIRIQKSQINYQKLTFSFRAAPGVLSLMDSADCLSLQSAATFVFIAARRTYPQPNMTASTGILVITATIVLGSNQKNKKKTRSGSNNRKHPPVTTPHRWGWYEQFSRRKSERWKISERFGMSVSLIANCRF